MFHLSDSPTLAFPVFQAQSLVQRFSVHRGSFRVGGFISASLCFCHLEAKDRTDTVSVDEPEGVLF